MKAVLIVDEDISGGRLVRAALSSRKYRVILVEDGREALSILEKRRDIDLVIAGHLVPGANGAEIIRRAKLLIPAAKAMVLTSKDRDLVLPVVSAAGADTILQKPFSIQGLLEEVDKLLKGD